MRAGGVTGEAGRARRELNFARWFLCYALVTVSARGLAFVRRILDDVTVALPCGDSDFRPKRGDW